MAHTTFASGSQAATVGTEHQLTTINEPGTYLLYVDRTAMLDGDVIELFGYRMTRTSGVEKIYRHGRWIDDPVVTDEGAMLLPITNPHTDAGAVRFTLTQTHGTSRTFPWNVDKIA